MSMAAQRVWSDLVREAGVGATAGTFDTVGTQVTLKSGGQVKEVLGFFVLIAGSIPTSGENGMPILRVNSKDLGISNQDFVLALAITDGVATNDKEAPVYAEFIPFKVDPTKSLDNAKIEFAITSPVSVTGGFDAVIAVVYSNFTPNIEYLIELMTGMCARATGGARAESDAGISATTATAFTETIAVTSDAQQLLGLLGVVNMNAPTSEDTLTGFVEFTASQINDFSPQKWPFAFGLEAPLGTPVGTPVPASRREGFYFPTRFDLPKVNFEMSVAMSLTETVGAAGDGVAAAKWR